MRFCETFVEFERSQGRRPRLRHELTLRTYVPCAHQSESVCQPGIGAAVIWVLIDRLLEVTGCLSKSFRRPLVPEIPALQIKVIGFVGLRLRHTRSGLPRRLNRPAPAQAELDFVGDLARNLRL